MNINQKGFANILLIVLVVVLAGAAGYFVLIRKPASDTNLEPTNLPNVESTSVNTMVAVTSPTSLPTSCKDETEGIPVITSLSNYSGDVGTKLEIIGCNFAGFEGDITAWIENSKGTKGLLRGDTGSNGKLIKVTLSSPLCTGDTSYSGLPCPKYIKLTPGVYKIYVEPWGKKSNEVGFTILPTKEVVPSGTRGPGSYYNKQAGFAVRYSGNVTASTSILTSKEGNSESEVVFKSDIGGTFTLNIKKTMIIPWNMPEQGKDTWGLRFDKKKNEYVYYYPYLGKDKCSESFFGREDILAYSEFSGDGLDTWGFYRIFTKTGWTISTYYFLSYSPNNNDTDKINVESEDTIKLAKDVMSTIKFDQGIEFLSPIRCATSMPT